LGFTGRLGFAGPAANQQANNAHDQKPGIANTAANTNKTVPGDQMTGTLSDAAEIARGKHRGHNPQHGQKACESGFPERHLISHNSGRAGSPMPLATHEFYGLYADCEINAAPQYIKIVTKDRLFWAAHQKRRRTGVRRLFVKPETGFRLRCPQRLACACGWYADQ
jgi:hypothetical protein